MRADELPSGTVTFLFTDLEVSTDLWERHGDAMAAAVAEHDALIDDSVAAHGGVVFKHVGDGACAAFPSADGALRAAVGIQRALADRHWPEVGPLRARIGIHTGPATPAGGDYLGATLNRCARVMAAAHGGQIVCTAATEAVLDRPPSDVELRDLGEHRLRGIERPFRLLQVTTPDIDRVFPQLRTGPVRRALPPGVRTSFVGREREIALLADVFGPGTLVTLTGMGGCGKTRLALEAARLLADRLDGVHFVELAELSDGSRVLPHVATALGAPAVAGDPLIAIDSVVGTGAHLVVLDNCEHLIDECAAAVDELIARCPALAVLATSREPLSVPGERVVRVPSLAADAAAQLFVDRAAAAGPQLDPGDVADVCSRLDGIPLAIELAAARLRHLTLDQLAERLNDRFRLLTGGARGAMRRQQTLRATLDWSHELLSDDERTVLRRLAVFVGGFTLPAAEHVCGSDLPDVLDVLARLVDRSLVVFDDLSGRYSLLESVRDYAGERLVEAGEAEAARDRHVAWAVELLKRHVELEADLLAGAPAADVSVEFENLSAAFRWAVDRDDAPSAVQICARMVRSWTERALFDEADACLGIIADVDAGPDHGRARAIVAIAWGAIAAIRNQFHEGHRRALAALDLIDSAGPDDLRPAALASAAITASVAVSVEEAERMLRDAIEQARALGDDVVAARALGQLGGFRMGAGAVDEARIYLEEAAALDSARSYGGADIELRATLALARLLTGDVAGARSAIDRLAGSPPESLWWGGATMIEALVAGVAGDVAGARALLAEQLRQLRALAVPLGETTLLVAFGALDVLAGDPARGARLLGAARAGFGREGAWRGPGVGGLYVQMVRRAREILGPDRVREERETGLALSAEEAIDLALAGA